MKSLVNVLNESLAEGAVVKATQCFGYKHPFIMFFHEIPDDAEERKQWSESAVTMIPGAPEPPNGYSLYDAHHGQNNLLSPKASTLRKENKDVLRSIQTAAYKGSNSFHELGGYHRDLQGLATAMILAPEDSSVEEFKKIINQYTKKSLPVKIQQFIGSDGGKYKMFNNDLVYRIFIGQEYIVSIVFKS